MSSSTQLLCGSSGEYVSSPSLMKITALCITLFIPTPVRLKVLGGCFFGNKRVAIEVLKLSSNARRLAAELRENHHQRAPLTFSILQLCHDLTLRLTL